jgi:hypothetical protein
VERVPLKKEYERLMFTFQKFKLKEVHFNGLNIWKNVVDKKEVTSYIFGNEFRKWKFMNIGSPAYRQLLPEGNCIKRL